jgi:ATP-dependent Clp protease ATP-binding subunit ClpB
MLMSMSMSMEVSDAAIAELAKVGIEPVFGARPLVARHPAVH